MLTAMTASNSGRSKTGLRKIGTRKVDSPTAVMPTMMQKKQEQWQPVQKGSAHQAFARNTPQRKTRSRMPVKRPIPRPFHKA